MNLRRGRRHFTISLIVGSTQIVYLVFMKTLVSSFKRADKVLLNKNKEINFEVIYAGPNSVHSLCLLLRQLLGLSLLRLQVLLPVVLHDVINIHQLARNDVSRCVGLESPGIKGQPAWGPSACSLRGPVTYSGYATSTNRCLFEAFSNRLRSKPACSWALVCSALISAQCSLLDWYLLRRLLTKEASPSAGTNW